MTLVIKDIDESRVKVRVISGHFFKIFYLPSKYGLITEHSFPLKTNYYLFC